MNLAIPTSTPGSHSVVSVVIEDRETGMEVRTKPSRYARKNEKENILKLGEKKITIEFSSTLELI